MMLAKYENSIQARTGDGTRLAKATGKNTSNSISAVTLSKTFLTTRFEA